MNIEFNSYKFKIVNGEKRLCSNIKDKLGKPIYHGDILTVPNPKIKYKVCFGAYNNNRRYEEFKAGVGFYLLNIETGEIADFSTTIDASYYQIEGKQ